MNDNINKIVQDTWIQIQNLVTCFHKWEYSSKGDIKPYQELMANKNLGNGKDLTGLQRQRNKKKKKKLIKLLQKYFCDFKINKIKNKTFIKNKKKKNSILPKKKDERLTGISYLITLAH